MLLASRKDRERGARPLGVQIGGEWFDANVIAGRCHFAGKVHRCRRHTPTIEWDRWSSRVLRMPIANFSREVWLSSTRIASSSPHNGSLATLGEQAHSSRMVVEQKQMRRDVFRASKSWPIRPGQYERADPQRNGDGAREHRAIARPVCRFLRILAEKRSNTVRLTRHDNFHFLLLAFGFLL